LLFTTNGNSNAVSVIDVPTLTVTKSMPRPGASPSPRSEPLFLQTGAGLGHDLPAAACQGLSGKLARAAGDPDLALRSSVGNELRETRAPIDIVHRHDGDDAGPRLHHRRAVDVEEG